MIRATRESKRSALERYGFRSWEQREDGLVLMLIPDAIIESIDGLTLVHSISEKPVDAGRYWSFVEDRDTRGGFLAYGI